MHIWFLLNPWILLLTGSMRHWSRRGFTPCIILLILVSSRFCHHLLFVILGRWLTDAAIIPGQMLILLFGIAWCVIVLCHSCVELSPLGWGESNAAGYLVVHLFQFCLGSPCFVLRRMTPCLLLNDPRSFVISCNEMSFPVLWYFSCFHCFCFLHARSKTRFSLKLSWSQCCTVQTSNLSISNVYVAGVGPMFS